MEGDDPPDEVPPSGVPVGFPPHLLLAARRAVRGDVLAEAEAVVARAAEAIPFGKEAVSLADALRERGPVAVGVGVAAGFAIRQVAKRLGRGGGFSFPSVLDPSLPFGRP